MKKLNNVLGLFDGISCGQVALNRVGIEYNNYYASEVNKWAIQIAMKNYPATIQLGDVKQVTSKDLPKIDLLLGGSPCTGFSAAGKGKNFNDSQSKLFFEFIRLLKEVKPTYFMLENVKMKKEWKDKISQLIGVEPILINSSLLSAQNRQRLYWTNIPNVKQPKDKEIKLKDVIDYSIKGALSSEYIKKRKQWNRWGNNFGTINTIKHPCLRAIGKADVILFTDLKRFTLPIECERLQTLPEGYTEGVSNTQRYKMIGNGWTVDVIAHILKGIKKYKYRK